MTVLVTGARGLTGGEIVRALGAMGFAVRAQVRRPEQITAIEGAAEVVAGDCTDGKRMSELIRGCDVIVHVAGIELGNALARVPDLRDALAVVVVSSAGVYSRHRSSAATYRSGEEALQAAFSRTVIVRPTMIYGSARDRNVHHVIAFARKYRFLPLVGSGRAPIQPIHYQDLARCVSALVKVRGPMLVDAGGQAAVSLREAALQIFSGLDIAPRFIPVPYAVAMLGAGIVDDLRSTRLRERVERMLEDRTVNNEQLIATTGVEPRSFAVGVREEIASLGLENHKG